MERNDTVAARFTSALSTYEEHAHVQREAADHLTERLLSLRTSFGLKMNLMRLMSHSMRNPLRNPMMKLKNIMKSVLAERAHIQLNRNCRVRSTSRSDLLDMALSTLGTMAVSVLC